MTPPVNTSVATAHVETTTTLARGESLPTIPPDMVADLRSDHAGEIGAVCIYGGILAVSRNHEVRAFAQEHLQTEQHHLALLTALLPAHQRSKLLPLWRFAGWLTGALPALFGSKAVFSTIDAVETYVDRHYAEQVNKLRFRPADGELLNLLEACRLDEVAHRNDARRRYTDNRKRARLWGWLVGRGSQAGVYLARRL
jgi:ubiquinone biosynthesis monooxygenase Coq7